MGTEMHVHIYSVARVFRTTNFIWYNVVWAHTVMAFLLPCFFVGQSLSVILMYWWGMSLKLVYDLICEECVTPHTSFFRK